MQVASGAGDKYYVSLRVLSRALLRTADQAKIATAAFFLETLNSSKSNSLIGNEFQSGKNKFIFDFLVPDQSNNGGGMLIKYFLLFRP